MLPSWPNWLATAVRVMHTISPTRLPVERAWCGRCGALCKKQGCAPIRSIISTRMALRLLPMIAPRLRPSRPAWASMHIAWLSVTKSMTGHTLGAAGAVEAVISIQAIRTGIIRPTINLHHPDPQCDLDYVPNEARHAAVNVAMSNVMGFGGHNTCLIFKCYEE